MLKWFIRKRIDGFEKAYGYDTSYMREMLDASTRGFLRFSKVMELSQHSEDTPKDAWFAAKLAATLSEDCGPCTQLVVQMAEQAGVDAGVLSGIITGDVARMGDDAALAYRYAKTALAHDPANDALREEILRRWGPRALVTLALALASSRIYPTLKYALGHGKTCSRVRVGGEDLVPHAATT